MALIQLPGRFVLLQRTTLCVKVIEAAVLFIALGLWDGLAHGWTAQAMLWFELAWVGYPILWVTALSVRLSIKLGAFVADIPVHTMLRIASIPLFGEIPICTRFCNFILAALDRLFDAHDHAIKRIWVIPDPASTQLQQGTISRNALTVQNFGGTIHMGTTHIGNNYGGVVNSTTHKP